LFFLYFNLLAKIKKKKGLALKAFRFKNRDEYLSNERFSTHTVLRFLCCLVIGGLLSRGPQNGGSTRDHEARNCTRKSALEWAGNDRRHSNKERSCCPSLEYHEHRTFLRIYSALYFDRLKYQRYPKLLPQSNLIKINSFPLSDEGKNN